MAPISSIKPVEISRKHAPALVFMIKELAEFEKMSESVEITEQQLADDIDSGAVHGFIIEDGNVPIAMTLFYYAYSTWQRQFIHMEDLYVRPQFRKMGYGKMLWVEIGKIAKAKKMKRIEWSVLDWNENAIRFYEKMQVTNLTKAEGWLIYRMDSEGIAQLVESQSKAT